MLCRTSFVVNNSHSNIKDFRILTSPSSSPIHANKFQVNHSLRYSTQKLCLWDVCKHNDVNKNV